MAAKMIHGNTENSPEDACALRETIRVRDDRICDLCRRVQNLSDELDLANARLRNEEQQVIRLRDQLTEMEREKLTARECVEAGRRLLNHRPQDAVENDTMGA